MAGELAARPVRLPGPTVLRGGQAATFAGVTGVPRLALSVIFLALVAGALWRWRPAHPWQWNAPRLGIALGLVTIAGWMLARAGDPASARARSGSCQRSRRVAGLVADRIPAGHRGRRRGRGPHGRGWQPRAETPVRYGQLAAGGFLLGAGGWIAGGCNLGHGLSGAAQLSVSSRVVVASMAAGVALSAGAARAVASWRSGLLARA